MLFRSTLSLLLAAWSVSGQDLARALDEERGNKGKVCVVPSFNHENKSDTPQILKAFKKCGKGGKIVFPEGVTYTLGELTVLTGCKRCEVVLDGTIRLSNDLKYWQSSNDTTMKFAFQDNIAAFIIHKFDGANIHSPKGTGLIDGQGQRWWDAFAGQEVLEPGSLRRPILLTIWESEHVTIRGIHFQNSPFWNVFVTDSKHIEFDQVKITSHSINKNPPKNSDGWDTYRSSHIKILNSHIVVGDDCFSFKPNSTDLTLKNLYCEGTHGISVGSLAQYPGVYDIVSDALIQNVTFVGGSNAVRIKTWAGERGSALVKNIKYKDIKMVNVTEALTIDACYFNLTPAQCVAFPSKVKLENIQVENVSGTTFKARAGTLVCAEGSLGCDVKFKKIDLKSVSGDAPVYKCTGIPTDSGLPCTP